MATNRILLLAAVVATTVAVTLPAVAIAALVMQEDDVFAQWGVAAADFDTLGPVLPAFPGASVARDTSTVAADGTALDLRYEGTPDTSLRLLDADATVASVACDDNVLFLTFTGPTTSSDLLRPGVLVSGGPRWGCRGTGATILRRVTGATPMDDSNVEYMLSTVDVGLADVFSDLTVYHSSSKPDSPVPGHSVDATMTLEHTDWNYGNGLRVAGSADGGDIAWGVVCDDCSVQADGTVELDLDIQHFELQAASLQASLDTTVGAGFSATASAPVESHGVVPLGGIEVPGKTFWIGPVPMRITFNMPVAATYDVSAHGAASVTATGSLAGTIDAGFTYTVDTGLKPSMTHTLTRTGSLADSTDGDADVSFTIDVTATASVDIVGTLTADISAASKSSVSTGATATGCAQHADLDVDSAVSAQASLHFGVLQASATVEPILLDATLYDGCIGGDGGSDAASLMSSDKAVAAVAPSGTAGPSGPASPSSSGQTLLIAGASAGGLVAVVAAVAVSRRVAAARRTDALASRVGPLLQPLRPSGSETRDEAALHGADAPLLKPAKTNPTMLQTFNLSDLSAGYAV